MADALAWLWRLGPMLDEPSPDAVGFGVLDEEEELRPLLEEGRLAGLVLLAPDPGEATRTLPPRRRVRGTARFPAGDLNWEFTVFDGGTPAARSRLGNHAVRDGRCLALALEPDTAWTELRGTWAISALAQFLPEMLDRSLVTLPPVGCVRLDDAPGTAYQVAMGRAKTDAREQRLIGRLRRTYRGSGACLNIAVCSRALDDERDVPIERVWPRATAELAAGVEEGVFTPVCHGYLHLDLDELKAGRPEYREFRDLEQAEAGRRIDATLDWQAETLGRRPETFVAPAWAYSEGAMRAAAERGLTSWLPPALAPMLDGGNVHETTNNGFRAMEGLGYGHLTSLAAHGLPPTPVLHGGLFDLRLHQLKRRRDLITAARLFLHRDLMRIPRIPGVRWIGADELVRILRAHATVSAKGPELDLGEASSARLVDARGVRPAVEG